MNFRLLLRDTPVRAMRLIDAAALTVVGRDEDPRRLAAAPLGGGKTLHHTQSPACAMGGTYV